jgi:maltose phosphorylase
MAISRFWSQRVNFSEPKQKYVILGVTGPNEYENNVNNNWYTNTIAAWTLDYTMGHIHSLRNSNPQRFRELAAKLNFDFEEETSLWRDIVDNLYFPYDEEGQIFLQQDGYLDKEQSLAEEIDPNQRPINQHWSWDRILRSPFIKQADVLHGIYFFEERYDKETIRRNFNFYEPRTVHESSLSACIHSILAARIGDIDTAYNLYLRTARLDLDDYNQEVAEGLHITSMGGTWMAVVEGFGGMRIADGTIRFNPLIPDQWEFYSFNVRFKGNLLNVKVNHEVIEIRNRSNATIPVNLYDQEYLLEGGDDLVVHRKK